MSLRTAGKVLAIGTLLVAIVATQWPFDHRLDLAAIRVRWRHIDWSWFPRHRDGRIKVDRDMIQNLLMLIPLGLGYGLWRRAGVLRTVLECLVVGFVTGATLELAQLATHGRFTTFPDVWRNAAGCLAGGVLAVIVRRAVPAPADAS